MYYEVLEFRPMEATKANAGYGQDTRNKSVTLPNWVWDAIDNAVKDKPLTRSGYLRSIVVRHLAEVNELGSVKP